MSLIQLHFLAPEDKNKWTPLWHKCYKSWEKSPYNINLWGDSDINKLVFEDDPDFYEILNNLPKIYKIEYVRFIILQKYGGAYIDMDIELKHDFLSILDFNKIYLMEGTFGCYVENSLMIGINQKQHMEFWERIKLFCKQKIYNNLNKCNDSYNVMHTIGPFALSEYMYKHVTPHQKDTYEILAYEHFASLTNEISFCRHYQTNTWNNNDKI